MSRASLPSRRARRRRRSAAVIAAISSAVVVVAAVVGVFAFALLRPETLSEATPAPASSSPVSPRASASPTVARTPTPSATIPPTPEPRRPAAQGCGGETLFGVWAHPDDDIIFGNPTISDAIATGGCVRTVFVTAGDAGKGRGYVEARELGILRAYNDMRGSDGLWDAADLVLETGVHVRRLTPQDDQRLSVMYLRLPDGNITGAGFAATDFATLGRLVDGGIPTLSPVFSGTDVSRDQLLASVRELAAGFAPGRVLTHIPRGSAFAPGDHPDHSVVGSVVREALSSDPAVGPGIRYLVGYPSKDLPRNLDGAILDAKVETYRIYSQQDEVIRCADRAACLGTRNFGEWLRRSYPKAEADLRMG